MAVTGWSENGGRSWLGNEVPGPIYPEQGSSTGGTGLLTRDVSINKRNFSFKSTISTVEWGYFDKGGIVVGVGRNTFDEHTAIYWSIKSSGALPGSEFIIVRGSTDGTGGTGTILAGMSYPVGPTFDIEVRVTETDGPDSPSNITVIINGDTTFTLTAVSNAMPYRGNHGYIYPSIADTWSSNANFSFTELVDITQGARRRAIITS